MDTIYYHSSSKQFRFLRGLNFPLGLQFNKMDTEIKEEVLRKDTENFRFIGYPVL